MKKYINTLLFFIAIVGVVFGYVKLPSVVKALADEVKETKEDIVETEDKVQQVAQTLEKYIAVQEAIQETKEEADARKEALLLELIKQLSEK